MRIFDEDGKKFRMSTHPDGPCNWQSLAGELLAQNELLVREVQRLAGLCERDALLGILNRRGLQRALQAEIENVAHTGVASSFIFIDLDHFKEINDRFGHEKGDQVLQKLAQHIAAGLRECDHFARIGGDEFGIILSQTTQVQALEKARELSLALIKSAQNWGFGAQILSFSAGASEIRAGACPDEIIRRADRQMYLQKKKGLKNKTIDILL